MSSKIRRNIIALFLFVILQAATEAFGQTAPNEPVLPCFMIRPEFIYAYSRPNIEAKLHSIFPSKLTCSLEIIRDDKGNEFRYVNHNDRTYPGRAYVRASDVHTDASRGGPGLDAWVAILRQHIAARNMFVAQELLIAAQSVFRWNSELAAIKLAIATDPLLAHTNTNSTIDTARAEVEGLRNRGREFHPPAPETERTTTPSPGSAVYAADTELRLLEEPREEGTVLAFVPIGAKAEILSISGPWARVRLEKYSAGSDFWEVKQGNARSISSDNRIREGYAPWNLFSDRPFAAAEFLSRAGVFEKAGRYPEAYRDLKRAAALDTPTSELGQRLRTAGVMAGQYIESIRLGNIKERIVPGANAHAFVEMQIVSRCRGNRLQAPVIDAELLFSRFFTDSGAGGWLSPKVFSAFPESACLIPFGECGCTRARPTRPEERRLQREFTDGPWLKVEVSVPARSFPDDSRLFMFETPNYYAGCPGRKGKRSIDIYPAVPWPEPGGKRTIWVKLKSLRGFRGAVEARDKIEARKRAKEILEKCDPEMQLVDRVRAIGGARIDNDCGC